MTFQEMIAKWHGKKYGAQHALAKALNMSAGCISHWSTGRFKPTADNVTAVATVLGCPEQDVLAVLEDAGRKRHAKGGVVPILKVVRLVATTALDNPNLDVNSLRTALCTVRDLCTSPE